MSNTVELIFNRYQNLSDSEEEYTVNNNINKKNNEIDNYDIVILHPHCNKCNKFHKKENNCELNRTISI